MVKHTIQCCLQDSQEKLLHHQESDIQDLFDEEDSDEDSNQDDTTLSWDSDKSIFLHSISCHTLYLLLNILF